MSRFVIFLLAVWALMACTTQNTKTQMPTNDSVAAQMTSTKANTPIDSTPTMQPQLPDTSTIYSEEDGGMTQIENKLFTNTTLKALYQLTLKLGDIDNAELLLPQLPNKSQEVEVNVNGLISINYTITPGKATIEMEYEGGVTTLILQQRDTGVNRTIAKRNKRIF